MAACLTALTALLLAGHGPWAGDVVLAITVRHGLNQGDLPVLGLWMVGIGACGHLWTRSSQVSTRRGR